METTKKTIGEWAAELGYTVIDPDGFDRTDPEVMKKLISKEEFDKGLPLCTVQKIADPDFTLDDHHEKNVEFFFRGAEKSLFSKSWKQLAEELKSIHDYINLMAKFNREKNVETQEEGTRGGETS